MSALSFLWGKRAGMGVKLGLSALLIYTVMGAAESGFGRDCGFVRCGISENFGNAKTPKGKVKFAAIDNIPVDAPAPEISDAAPLLHLSHFVVGVNDWSLLDVVMRRDDEGEGRRVSPDIGKHRIVGQQNRRHSRHRIAEIIDGWRVAAVFEGHEIPPDEMPMFLRWFESDQRARQDVGSLRSDERLTSGSGGVLPSLSNLRGFVGEPIGGLDRLFGVDGSRLHFVQLALHDRQLLSKNNSSNDPNNHKSPSEQANMARPPRHHPFIGLVLSFGATAAMVFVAFKSAEYADDYGSRWWWLPFCGFLGLAFWFADHAIEFALQIL